MAAPFKKLSNQIEKIQRYDTGLLILERLMAEGLPLARSDVVFGESGFFTFLPDGTLFRTVIYRAVTEEREFRNTGLPTLHLFHCDKLKSEQKNEKYRHSVVYRESNGFDLTVYSGRAEVKIYREEPLGICPECEMIYRKLYGPEQIDPGVFMKDSLINNRLDPLFDIGETGEISLPREEWQRIALVRKKIKSYDCEKCGETLKGSNAEFLDGHYLFNERYGKDRIRLLCVACHAQEKGHESLRETDRYLRFREKKAKAFQSEDSIG